MDDRACKSQSWFFTTQTIPTYLVIYPTREFVLLLPRGSRRVIQKPGEKLAGTKGEGRISRLCSIQRGQYKLNNISNHTERHSRGGPGSDDARDLWLLQKKQIHETFLGRREHHGVSPHFQGSN